MIFFYARNRYYLIYGAWLLFVGSAFLPIFNDTTGWELILKMIARQWWLDLFREPHPVMFLWLFMPLLMLAMLLSPVVILNRPEWIGKLSFLLAIGAVVSGTLLVSDRAIAQVGFHTLVVSFIAMTAGSVIAGINETPYALRGQCAKCKADLKAAIIDGYTVCPNCGARIPTQTRVLHNKSRAIAGPRDLQE